MTTKSHKTLTGNQLHEPKGADAATANTLYRSDGAGSGSWVKVDHNSLATTGNPFGAQLLHIREEQTSGTNSTTALAAAVWNTRVLNTSKTNEISGASLASNQITLPAGTYYIHARTMFGTSTSANYEQAVRIRNITDGTTTIVGESLKSGIGALIVNTPIFMNGRFTLSGTKVLELQQYLNAGGGLANGGLAIGSGETEVYTDVLIWKVS